MANPTNSAVAARAAVVGRYAELSALAGTTPGNGAVVALLWDWEISMNFDFVDTTAHGDTWKQKAFLDGDWTARAKGYIVPAGTAQYIKSLTLTNVPTAFVFSGWSTATGGQLLWQGVGFIQKGRISAPMSMMEQEFEIVSSGVPTAGLG